MRGLRCLAVPSGLGLAVFFILTLTLIAPAGLAAAPGPQEAAVPAPPPATAALSAAPAPQPAAAPLFETRPKRPGLHASGPKAEKPPSLDEFIASLRGEQPRPASSCQIATACYCGGIVSCSGTTCFKSVGCYVVCDDGEIDCPGCSEPYCA
jgi:hypothetical protein